MSKNENSDKKRNNDDFSKKSLMWAVKIVLITFVLSLFSSLLSQIAVSGSDILIAVMLLIFMVITSIIFDVIGVGVASCSACDPQLFEDKHIAGIVKMLIENAEKVNNICADVIGDVCGVLSGACGASIVVAISQTFGQTGFIPAVTVSALIASATVGGKAFMKRIAVRNSSQIVIFTARNLKKILKFLKKDKT